MERDKPLVRITITVPYNGESLRNEIEVWDYIEFMGGLVGTIQYHKRMILAGISDYIRHKEVGMDG